MSDKKEIIEIKEVSEKPEAKKQTKKRKPVKKTTPAKSQLTRLKKKIKEQTEKLKALSIEKDDYRDKYLRNLAEIDNFRKRIRREKEEYQKFILGEFLLDLLPIIDNLERALNTQSPSENETSILSGIEMIYKQFQGLLKKHHVIEIEALNKPFDPGYHQAISKIEQEGIEEPVVIEVYQKGYLYNEKLLRPVFVKVAIPEEEKETAETE